MTAAEERTYQCAILRDAIAIFSAAYLSENQRGPTPDMKVAFALIETGPPERRAPLVLALARFGADFVHFVERCAIAAEASQTVLEPGFSAELLIMFARQQEQNIDYFERTGRYT